MCQGLFVFEDKKKTKHENLRKSVMPNIRSCSSLLLVSFPVGEVSRYSKTTLRGLCICNQGQVHSLLQARSINTPVSVMGCSG